MKPRLLIQAPLLGAMLAAFLLFAASTFADDGNFFDSREKLVSTLSTEGNEDWALKFVGKLTSDQVRWLNQALNNAEKSGLSLNFDQQLMQRIIDEDLDKHGIRKLTLALEQEARFMEKYNRTGDEKFLIKADREREKFLARIDGNSPPSLAGSAPAATSGITGEALAEKQVKEVRHEARKAARDAAREARKAAREATRDAVKEAAKNAKKG